MAASQISRIAFAENQTYADFKLSQKLDRVISILIDLKDRIDGDPDFELSSGATIGINQLVTWWVPPSSTVVEKKGKRGRRRQLVEVDDCDHKPDMEPSLGSLEGVDQRCWSYGSSSDCEYQCEDEGFDSDSKEDHRKASTKVKTYWDHVNERREIAL